MCLFSAIATKRQRVEVTQATELRVETQGDNVARANGARPSVAGSHGQHGHARANLEITFLIFFLL
jgi:hypothetical protein